MVGEWVSFPAFQILVTVNLILQHLPVVPISSTLARTSCGRKFGGPDLCQKKMSHSDIFL